MDKRIPIALIFTILVQTGLAVWWVSNLSHRVDTATTMNDRQEARLTSVEAVMNAQAVNAATFSAQLTAMRDSLNELKTEQIETNRLLRGLVPQGGGE